MAMSSDLDFLYQTIPESPAPMKVTSTTTLDDVIAITIFDSPPPPADDITMTTSSGDPDAYLDSLLNSLLNSTPAKEKTTPVKLASPCPDSRLDNSLSHLLPSPTPTNRHACVTELQSLLRTEVQKDPTPNSLIQTVQPPTIQLCSINNREIQLQQRFSQLQFFYPTEIQELSTFYRYHSAMIETSRFQELYQFSQYPGYQHLLHSYYDNQLHLIIDRVEASIAVLERSSNRDNPVSSKPVVYRSRPALSKKAVQMMEEWYHDNIHHPYPNYTIIQNITTATGITEEQVKKWFGNKRNRCKNARPYTKKQKKMTRTQLQYML